MSNSWWPSDSIHTHRVVLSFVAAVFLYIYIYFWATYATQWVSCPRISLFILRWSSLTGDMISPHGLRPRHRELLHLYRCDPIGGGGGGGALHVWAACHCISAQTSWPRADCVPTVHAHKSISEAITGHPVTSRDSCYTQTYATRGGGGGAYVVI